MPIVGCDQKHQFANFRDTTFPPALPTQFPNDVRPGLSLHSEEERNWPTNPLPCDTGPEFSHGGFFVDIDGVMRPRMQDCLAGLTTIPPDDPWIMGGDNFYNEAADPKLGAYSETCIALGDCVCLGPSVGSVTASGVQVVPSDPNCFNLLGALNIVGASGIGLTDGYSVSNLPNAPNFSCVLFTPFEPVPNCIFAAFCDEDDPLPGYEQLCTTTPFPNVCPAHSFYLIGNFASCRINTILGNGQAEIGCSIGARIYELTPNEDFPGCCDCFEYGLTIGSSGVGSFDGSSFSYSGPITGFDPQYFLPGGSMSCSGQVA